MLIDDTLGMQGFAPQPLCPSNGMCSWYLDVTAYTYIM